MKLNLDCVRDILLTLESENTLFCCHVKNFVHSDSLSSYSEDELLYCCLRLYEGRYINLSLLEGYTTDSPLEYCIEYVYGLTFTGHQFLESIREPERFKKVKNICSKVTSGSFSIISSVASTLLSEQLKTLL